jgi:hypothetical protein
MDRLTSMAGDTHDPSKMTPRSLLDVDPAGPEVILPSLVLRTRQEVPDCTIYQHRMGLHRDVARILDPNDDCIRRIVIEVVQLMGQAMRVLHSPKNQRWNVHPERSGGGRFCYTGKE